ncbi:MAG: hypothetical protein KME35_04940 [Aphanocapsa sp. GSE-SYN-MK-11-07L]|jgi:hypothetical protein|nr:hypothetical protein [Aphanocapsa sp. GSE-SYN-MK-11-07L]
MANSVPDRRSLKEYEWELTPDYVPPHITELPRGQGFSWGKLIKFNSIVAKGVLSFIVIEFFYFFNRLLKGKFKFQRTADFGIAGAFKAIREWDKIEDFKGFFKPWTSFDLPKVADTWQDDREFGQQRLCGINPAFIRKCRAEDLAPEGKFPVTDQTVAGLLPSSSSLAEELAGDRLYLLDYQILSDIITSDLEDQLGRYPVAPLCLLIVNKEQQLMPLAIRLQQGEFHDLETNPIFTPSSPEPKWLMAKVAVASTDIAYQGIVSHLLNTHLIIETFAVTTFRQFSPQHLIFQLLRSHFFNTFAINEMARGIFLGHDGFFDNTGALGYTGSNELLERAYTGKGKNYDGEPHLFYRTALPVDLAAREVSNLPGYHYRDDALKIWNAIQAYVADILRLAYKSAADLLNDAELQAWKQELVSPNYGKLAGLLPPEKADQINGALTDLEDLTTILTTVIFTASAQHSAVNFGQYEYAGWVPNMPFATYKPFTDLLRQKENPVDLLPRLPDRLLTIKQMVLVKALSMPTPDSSPSLLTMANPFEDPAAQKFFQDFQLVQLQKIEQEITERNASAAVPYIRLLPSQIAQSIAI